MKKKKTVPPTRGTATTGDPQPVPPSQPAKSNEKPAAGNGFKQFLLLILSVLLLLLFFKESYFDSPNYNKFWWDGRIMAWYEDYKEQKLNLDIEYRKEARYDNYRFARYITTFFEKRGNTDKVLLLVPPTDYFKANGLPVHVPEPAVFYYFTGLKTIWANSPEATKANWVLGVKNGGFTFDSVVNKQTLQDTIAAFKKIQYYIMSGIMIILLFTIIQFIAGFGILNLFKIDLKPGMFISLAILLGVAVFSVMPFVLQLAYIPLTSTNVFISIILATALLNLKFKYGIARLAELKNNIRFKIKIYELPYIALIVFIVFVSAWRCFYFPPTPRDLTSGAEVIAEYAIREKTMINSVFSVNLETTNNVFKPPYITCLQIIYKYAGFEFGQVWLSTIVACFLIFLYHALTLSVHRVIAGLLMILFLAIPEMFSYTVMVLFDYSNAVFFFLSIWFLYLFYQNQQRNYLAFAGLLMAIATYIRSETLILACLMVPAIVWHHWKNKTGIVKGLVSSAFFVAPSVLAYVISITIFINRYLPVQYNIGQLVNANLGDLSPFFTRLNDMTAMIFDEFIKKNELAESQHKGIGYYGYIFYFFVVLLALELVFNRFIFKRKMNSTARNWLYAVLIIYFGFPLLGYLLPLLDLDNSTKRGLFKIFPLMLLYLANNSLLVDWSQRLTKWEMKK